MEVNSVQQSYSSTTLENMPIPMLENIDQKTTATHQTKSLTKERSVFVKSIHVVLSHDVTTPTLPTGILSRD